MDYLKETKPIPEDIFNNIVKYLEVLMETPAMIYNGFFSVFDDCMCIIANNLKINTYNHDCTIDIDYIDRIRKRYKLDPQQMLKIASLGNKYDEALTKTISFRLNGEVIDMCESVSNGLFDNITDADS